MVYDGAQATGNDWCINTLVRIEEMVLLNVVIVSMLTDVLKSKDAHSKKEIILKGLMWQVGSVITLNDCKR